MRTSTPRRAAWHAWVRQAISIVAAVSTVLALKHFLIQNYQVPSASMEPTLRIGDFLIANHAIYGTPIPLTPWRVPGWREPQRGEIVVFRPTYNDPIISVVKRVIGIPGDILEMRGGEVWLNGTPLSEPYVQSPPTPDLPLEEVRPGAMTHHRSAWAAETPAEPPVGYRDNWGPLRVPQGHFFLLGDNRGESLDSRFMGFVPRTVIRGRVERVYFSIEPSSQWGPPWYQRIRWDRLGQDISE